jgi:hypothetical protein
MYDALGYVKQCKEIERYNKRRVEAGETERLTGAEFLSGLKKTDKLTPQFTIVIYYGESEWDGPRTLKEMLDIPKAIEPYIQDYSIHLLEARKYDYRKFKTKEVTSLFQLLNISMDKRRLKEETSDLCVPKETLLIAGKICGVKEWLAMAIEQKEEVITMSTAWEEAKQELREEGREEGRKEFKNILLLLKKGKSKEELLDIGYDEKIIDDAIFIM